MKVDGRKLNHSQLEAIRFEAVKAVQAGEPPTAVAHEMGLYTNRVFVWLAAYRAGGWDALRARKASGRPKRVTGSQMKWIYNTVTSKNPTQLQFPFALWTRGMIRTLIWRKYRIKLSLVSVGRLLAQMGLTCQKPLSRAFEQDATLVKAWVKREFPKKSGRSFSSVMRAGCGPTFTLERHGAYEDKLPSFVTPANDFT